VAIRTAGPIRRHKNSLSKKIKRKATHAIVT
jgi:hypothetical protein